jgi:hypothetical protein
MTTIITLEPHGIGHRATLTGDVHGVAYGATVDLALAEAAALIAPATERPCPAACSGSSDRLTGPATLDGRCGTCGGSGTVCPACDTAGHRDGQRPPSCDEGCSCGCHS